MKIVKNIVFILLFLIVNIIILKIVDIKYFAPVLCIELLFFLGIGGIFFSKTMVELGLNINRKHCVRYLLVGGLLFLITSIRYIRDILSNNSAFY